MIGTGFGAHHRLYVSTDHRALHVWLGSLGVHLFWPDFWKSRPDFTRRWR
jgi:hypothetical protein